MLEHPVPTVSKTHRQRAHRMAAPARFAACAEKRPSFPRSNADASNCPKTVSRSWFSRSAFSTARAWALSPSSTKAKSSARCLQMCATMAKVPALFFSTLLVTFPSLYVFNALVGSRLTLASVWRLMIAMLAVMMAILASLGPIVAFFSISTTNYPFMLILNVIVFGLAGFLGLKFLLHTLHRLSIVLEDAKTASETSCRTGNCFRKYLQRAGN